MLQILIAIVYFVTCVVTGTKLFRDTQREKVPLMGWLASAALLISGVVLFFAMPYIPSY